MTNQIKLATTLLAVLFAICARAQTPTPAPVPSNFATAKTAFLASAGAPDLAFKEKEGISILYSSMYRALLAANIYSLQTNPASADLSMAIFIGKTDTDVTGGNSSASPFIRLAVYDTKTQSLLWNIDEPISGAFREKTFEKNVDTATAHIVVDLKQLASGNIPGTSSTTSLPGAPQDK